MKASTVFSSLIALVATASALPVEDLAARAPAQLHTFSARSWNTTSPMNSTSYAKMNGTSYAKMNGTSYEKMNSTSYAKAPYANSSTPLEIEKPFVHGAGPIVRAAPPVNNTKLGHMSMPMSRSVNLTVPAYNGTMKSQTSPFKNSTVPAYNNTLSMDMAKFKNSTSASYKTNSTTMHKPMKRFQHFSNNPDFVSN